MKTLTKGSVINLLGSISSSGIRFLTVFCLVRILGKDEYGVYIQLLVLFEFFSTLGLLGLPKGVSRYMAILQDKKEWTGIWAIAIGVPVLLLGVNLIIGFGLFQFAEIIATDWFKTPVMKKLIDEAWLLLPAYVLFMLSTHFFVGLDKMDFRSYLDNFYQSFVWFLMVLVFYFWRPNLIYYFWGRILLYSVGVFLAYILLRMVIPFFLPKWQEIKDRSLEVLTFSVPLLFTSIVNRLLIKIDIFMLGYFLAPGQVAIYYVAARLSDIFTIILNPINTVMYPHSAKLAAKNDFEQLGRDYQIICQRLLEVSVPIALIFIIFARELLVVFNPDFYSGQWTLVALVIGSVFNIGTGSSGVILSMAGYPKMNLFNVCIVGLANVIMDIVLIPRMSILGAAIATAISIAMLNFFKVIEIYYLWRLMPFTIRTFRLFGIFIATGAFTYLGLMLFDLEGVLRIIVGSAIIFIISGTGIYFFSLTNQERTTLHQGKDNFIRYFRVRSSS